MKPLICLAVLVLTSAKYGVAEEKKAAEARQFESHDKHAHTLDLHPAFHQLGPHVDLKTNIGYSSVFNKASGEHIIDLLNIDNAQQGINKNQETVTATGEGFKFNDAGFAGEAKSGEERKEGLSNYRTEGGTEASFRGAAEVSRFHKGGFSNKQKGAEVKHFETKHTSINLEHIGKQDAETTYGGTIHIPNLPGNKVPQLAKQSKYEIQGKQQLTWKPRDGNVGKDGVEATHQYEKTQPGNVGKHAIEISPLYESQVGHVGANYGKQEPTGNLQVTDYDKHETPGKLHYGIRVSDYDNHEAAGKLQVTEHDKYETPRKLHYGIRVSDYDNHNPARKLQFTNYDKHGTSDKLHYDFQVNDYDNHEALEKLQVTNYDKHGTTEKHHYGIRVNDHDKHETSGKLQYGFDVGHDYGKRVIEGKPNYEFSYSGHDNEGKNYLNAKQNKQGRHLLEGVGVNHGNAERSQVHFSGEQFIKAKPQLEAIGSSYQNLENYKLEGHNFRSGRHQHVGKYHHHHALETSLLNSGYDYDKHESEELETQIGEITAGKPSGAKVSIYTVDGNTKTLYDSAELNFDEEKTSKPIVHKSVPSLKYQLVKKKPPTETELIKKAVDSGSVIIKHVPVAYAEYIDKPYPLKIYVEKPVVHQKVVQVPYKVEIPKPVAVEKKVPFPVKVFEEEHKPYPIYKDVPVPVAVYVEKPVPKYVEKPYPVKVTKVKKTQIKPKTPLTWDEFEAVKASAEKSFSEYFKKHTDGLQKSKISEDSFTKHEKAAEQWTSFDKPVVKISENSATQHEKGAEQWISFDKPVAQALTAQKHDWKLFDKAPVNYHLEPIVGNFKHFQHWKPEEFNNANEQHLNAEFQRQHVEELQTKPETHHHDFQQAPLKLDENTQFQNWKKDEVKPETYKSNFETLKTPEIKHHYFQTAPETEHWKLEENKPDAQFQNWKEAEIKPDTYKSNFETLKYHNFQKSPETDYGKLEENKPDTQFQNWKEAEVNPKTYNSNFETLKTPDIKHHYFQKTPETDHWKLEENKPNTQFQNWKPDSYKSNFETLKTPEITPQHFQKAHETDHWKLEENTQFQNWKEEEVKPETYKSNFETLKTPEIIHKGSDTTKEHSTWKQAGDSKGERWSPRIREVYGFSGLHFDETAPQQDKTVDAHAVEATHAINYGQDTPLADYKQSAINPLSGSEGSEYKSTNHGGETNYGDYKQFEVNPVVTSYGQESSSLINHKQFPNYHGGKETSYGQEFNSFSQPKQPSSNSFSANKVIQEYNYANSLPDYKPTGAQGGEIIAHDHATQFPDYQNSATISLHGSEASTFGQAFNYDTSHADYKKSVINPLPGTDVSSYGQESSSFPEYKFNYDNSFSDYKQSAIAPLHESDISSYSFPEYQQSPINTSHGQESDYDYYKQSGINHEVARYEQDSTSHARSLIDHKQPQTSSLAATPETSYGQDTSFTDSKQSDYNKHKTPSADETLHSITSFKDITGFDAVDFSPHPGKVFDETHKPSSLQQYSGETLSTKLKRLEGHSNEDMLKTIDTETSASEHVTTKKQLPLETVAEKRSSENHKDVDGEKTKSVAVKVTKKRRRVRNPISASKQPTATADSSKTETKESTTEATTSTVQSVLPKN